jgi:transposase
LTKKNSTGKTLRRRGPRWHTSQALTIGIDLGDQNSSYCVLDNSGAIQAEERMLTTRGSLALHFENLAASRIVVECGTHSPWVSRWLKERGHEVIVANPRNLRLLTESSDKNDSNDAYGLASIGRTNPELLKPIRHRGEEAQADLLRIRARAALVEARTKLLNTARGLVKPFGERLPKCDADTAGPWMAAELPEAVRGPIESLLRTVEQLTVEIQAHDREIQRIAATKYAETAQLKQVYGVGDLIALGFVLTIEDPSRFEHSRDVGCYLGVRPKQRDSGRSSPQLGITKEGDGTLRMLLTNAAQIILSRRSPDTDLKRWGLKLCERGGKRAKKKAVSAVVRKLAILLHRLWVSGERYEPLRNSRVATAAA